MRYLFNHFVLWFVCEPVWLVFVDLLVRIIVSMFSKWCVRGVSVKQTPSQPLYQLTVYCAHWVLSERGQKKKKPREVFHWKQDLASLHSSPQYTTRQLYASLFPTWLCRQWMILCSEPVWCGRCQGPDLLCNKRLTPTRDVLVQPSSRTSAVPDHFDDVSWLVRVSQCRFSVSSTSVIIIIIRATEAVRISETSIHF